MFCKQCGTQLEETAKFCSGCGTPTLGSSPSAPAQDTTRPVMTAKPVFVPWVTMAAVIPFQLFFTVWAGGFFGGFSMFAVKALGLDLPVYATFVFFGALAFFGIPFIAYTAKKNTYARTEYKFYTDRLEYAEGFWTAEQKTVSYRNITETNLRKGVIQKKYGLGTIVLSTPATGIQQGTARSGILIRDIENAESIYEKVKELVN